MARMADLYSRIGIGQLETVAEQLQNNDVGKRLRVDEHAMGIEALANALKQASYHFFGVSKGVHRAIDNPELPNRFKDAHDLQQVIRYALCQAAPEEHVGSIWAYPPHQYSAEALPVCVLVEQATPIRLKATG